MKKILFTTAAVILTVLMLAASVGAEDVTRATVSELAKPATFTSPFIVTEAFPNPSTSKDYYDYIEIMNVSDVQIDLYNYMFWGLGGDAELSIESVKRLNYFSNTPGEAVLEPGELAIVFVVTVEHFTNNKYAKLNDDGSTNLDLEKLLSDFITKYGKSSLNADAKIFVMNRTVNGENNTNGSGYANRAFCTYWITERVEDASKVVAGDLKEENVILSFDTNGANVQDYVYLYTYPTDGGKKMELLEKVYIPTAGYLSAAQYSILKGEEPVQTTEPIVTTAEPSTATNAKPGTDASPTEAEPTTGSGPKATLPTTQPATGKNNCGSVGLPVLLAQAVAVIGGSVMFAVIKKRK